MKGPSRKEEHFQKSSTVLSHNKIKCKSPVIPLSFDEAKACCKARKRKERQESISSICQERKVIRSSSEERPCHKKYFESKSIRRVSSSEDFQKSDAKHVTSTHFLEKNASPKRQNSDIILVYDEDCEHEKRRSHERFSKPLALKNKQFKKPTVRCLSKPKFKPDLTYDKSCETKVEDKVQQETLLHIQNEVKDRSPSPIRSPELDLSTLHEQVDFSEPLLSCANHQINENTETLPGLSVASNRLLSSPRNSIIATHRIYLDPDVQQANFNKSLKPIDNKVQKITKQIKSTKKKIKKYEHEFECKYGYKLSHADKLNDKNIRKLYIELAKLKKEQKVVSEECANISGEEVEASRNLQYTLCDIERRLAQKRDQCHRPNLLEQMSNEELIQEKIAVQKVLLYLESIHGRPNNKEDRNLARPLYDRYRNLKRMMTKIQTPTIGNELPTIHEDETMTFVQSSTPLLSEIDSEKSSILTSTDSSDTDTSISENLHSLSKIELIERHRILTEKKKELRRAIKLFEVDVQFKSGKMVQKEDKLVLEDVYNDYKKVKAKLKLLDALVGKQL